MKGITDEFVVNDLTVFTCNPSGVVTDEQAEHAKQMFKSRTKKPKKENQIKTLSPEMENMETPASKQGILLLKQKFESNVN